MAVEILDFDYVVQRQEKGRVCFGSGLERKTLEDDTRGMTSRHARTHLRQNLPIAPGMYEIPAEALALGPLMNRVRKLLLKNVTV